MGSTIWLQVRHGDETQGDDRDHSFILLLQEELDSLAASLGVAKPSSFFDYSVVAGEMQEEFGIDDEAAEAGSPDNGEPVGAWCSAADGERSLAALVRELRERPGSLAFSPDASQQHWPAAVVEDLAHCVTRLAPASRAGHQFRFLIVQ